MGASEVAKPGRRHISRSRRGQRRIPVRRLAVGQANYPHHVIKLVIERWTGTRWELVAVPNPPARKGAGNI